MPDEGGENRIYQFLSFSVYFWKFWLRQGGLLFYGSQKGDEGADTDLMFQFCLPNPTSNDHVKYSHLTPDCHYVCEDWESYQTFQQFEMMRVVLPCSGKL